MLAELAHGNRLSAWLLFWYEYRAILYYLSNEKFYGFEESGGE